MSRARGTVFGLATFAFGGVWLLAAGWKILAPLAAYEFTATVVSPGLAAKSALVAAITAEALLGSLMVLRAISHVRGYVLSLAGLAIVAGILLHARAAGGGQMPCGCYGDAILATVDDELVRDAAMAGVLSALTAWGWRDARRKAQTGA